MRTRVVKASTFKASCLALMDEIAATGETLIVTKRGKPVVQVTPAGAVPSLRGSVRYLVSDDELIAPTGERWNAERR